MVQRMEPHNTEISSCDLFASFIHTVLVFFLCTASFLQVKSAMFDLTNTEKT